MVQLTTVFRHILLVIAALVAIALTVVVGVAVYRTWQTRHTERKSAPAMNDDDTEVSATAESIANNYAINEIAADKHYKDRAFRVRGTVIGVTRDDGGAPTAVLNGGSGAEIIARFRTDDDAATLRAGHEAQLVCIGGGATREGRPLLMGCIVAR